MRKLPKALAVVARWLLVCASLALVLLFTIIGVLHTFRGTPVSSVQVVGNGDERVTITDPVFRQTVEAMIHTPLHEGNRVTLLLNGNEFFPTLFRDLRAARSSITLQIYYAEPGVVADSIRAILSERARAGVRVYCLYDGVGSTLSGEYYDSLRAAGAQVRRLRPVRLYNLNRAQNRSHIRGIVIDGVVGYTGGFGMADKWRGDGRHVDQWRDTNVRFVGPAVTQLQAAFAAGWAEASGTLLTGPTFFPAAGLDSTGTFYAGLLYTTPTIGSTPAERFRALSITGAQRTLYISNSYFVPDDDLVGSLRAAARRGVDVRVLAPNRLTDVPSVRLAGRDRYAELLRAGVRIYEYQPAMMHAKTFVADGIWSSVGSMNFDNRSTALNDEANLVVYDPRLGARLDSVFRDDLTHSREILLPEFSRRPWLDKLLEDCASLLARVM
jgi:cardiolipin synthase